MNQNRNKDLLR